MTNRKGREKGTEADEVLAFWGCFKTVRRCESSSVMPSCPSLTGASHQVPLKLCGFRRYRVHSPEATVHPAESPASAVHGSINRKPLSLPSSGLPGIIIEYSNSHNRRDRDWLALEVSSLHHLKASPEA